MKRFLLTSASLLALTIAAPTASATTFLFTGAAVDFKIPVAGTYQILAFGAQGGGGNVNHDTGAVGGKGAKVQGDFQFAADHLQIVVGGVGQTSTTYAGGGGGGSFVVIPGNDELLLLMVAGGGGGAGAGLRKDGPPTESCYGGKTGKDGGDGHGDFASRGVGGSGGSGGGYPGGGGGGGGFAGAGGGHRGGLGGFGGARVLMAGAAALNKPQARTPSRAAAAVRAAPTNSAAGAGAAAAPLTVGRVRFWLPTIEPGTARC